MELEKAQKQGRDEKASRTLPHYGMMPAPYLASNAMHLHPSSLYYLHTKAN